MCIIVSVISTAVLRMDCAIIGFNSVGCHVCICTSVISSSITSTCGGSSGISGSSCSSITYY